MFPLVFPPAYDREYVPQFLVWLSKSMSKIAVALAALFPLTSFNPALAQPTDAPTNCTDAMSAGSTFIGH
jgi:hypothetical protein